MIRKELIAMSDLNSQAELRYNKLIIEYNLKQKDLDNYKDKLINSEQRSKDMIADFSSRKDYQFEKYTIRLQELEKVLLQLKNEKNDEILIKNGYRSLLGSVQSERYGDRNTVIKWLQDFVTGVRGTVVHDSIDFDSGNICICICGYIYIYICIYICIYMHLNIYIYIYIYILQSAYLHVHVHIYINIHMYVYVYTHICIYRHMYINLYTYINTCIHAYTYTCLYVYV
jgi:hypothetical protein